jgi:hypothetical protein
MGVTAWAYRDIQREAVTLQHGSRGRNDKDVRQLGHFFIAVERPLRHVGNAAIKICENCPFAATLEAKGEKPRLANSPAFHLARLILILRQFGSQRPKAMSSRQ